MITKEEFAAFSNHVENAVKLADRLSESNRPDEAAAVMALRQSLRACMTRAVQANTVIVETDAVLDGVLQGAGG